MHSLILSPDSIKREPIWVWVRRTLPLTFGFHTYNLRTYGDWLTHTSANMQWYIYFVS
jgi:hypothetical protein